MLITTQDVVQRLMKHRRHDALQPFLAAFPDIVAGIDRHAAAILARSPQHVPMPLPLVGGPPDTMSQQGFVQPMSQREYTAPSLDRDDVSVASSHRAASAASTAIAAAATAGRDGAVGDHDHDDDEDCRPRVRIVACNEKLPTPPPIVRRRRLL